MHRQGVLFICTHNSARSQMAEAWLRHLAGDRFEAYSAGVAPGVINPLTVKAMAEVGIDLSGAEAQGIDEYLGRVPVHRVITVCDKAATSCPRVWPGAAERLNWFFDDPSAATGSEGEKLATFRRVRDEIRAKVEAWLSELDANAASKMAGTR